MEEDKAWFWGDYRYCGSPRWMLEDMLTHIKLTHPDIDYVMWTGDVVPHNVWSTTTETNLQIVRETNQMIQEFFPTIPVFPVVGNHEMSPLDQFPDPDDDDTPEELSADWLFSELSKQWSLLVPHLDNSTVRRAAYYSVLLKEDLRIISFNSMYGYSSNLWLVEDSQDPADELTWLEDHLHQAEAAGERVHLLGHIPPGIVDSERVWSREFNRIVVRYENTIRGQFYGHTHYDEFEVFHDGDRPAGVAYIAPSQTPWYGLNPAYRIYYVDGDRQNSTRVSP
nr:sphingomyelin phosphodiesterase-like [Cherax quadricarinatus]